MAKSKLSKLEKAARFYEKNPNATADEAVAALGMSKSTVYNLKYRLNKNKPIELARMPRFLPRSAPNEDTINNPSHYVDGGVETIDFIEAKRLGYHLGNVVKYISRAGKKGTNRGLEDLRKARWYLDRAIERNEHDPVTR